MPDSRVYHFPQRDLQPPARPWRVVAAGVGAALAVGLLAGIWIGERLAPPIYVPLEARSDVPQCPRSYRGRALVHEAYRELDAVEAGYACLYRLMEAGVGAEGEK